MAGICASTLTYPLDVIRARQTVAGSNSNAGILRIASQIMAKEGATSFYKRLTTDSSSCSAIYWSATSIL